MSKSKMLGAIMGVEIFTETHIAIFSNHGACAVTNVQQVAVGLQERILPFVSDLDEVS
jgi:hypothetical protein